VFLGVENYAVPLKVLIPEPPRWPHGKPTIGIESKEPDSHQLRETPRETPRNSASALIAFRSTATKLDADPTAVNTTDTQKSLSNKNDHYRVQPLGAAPSVSK
jgi:hypothetical protein